MQRFFLILGIFLLTVSIAAAEAPKSLVRITGLAENEVKAFLAADYDVAARGPGSLDLVVSQDELDAIKKAGRKIRSLIPDLDAYVKSRLASQTPQVSYYTYETMTTTLQDWAKKYPEIARLTTIGKSVEGREIWAVKVSDNPDVDENEPSCLVTGAHHAREWISVEVPMATLKAYLEGYGNDERLTRLVNSREVWFVPMVNPDGVTYSQTKQRYWRKNRRPLPGSTAFGIDLNRNYGYHWGSAGSSDSYTSDTYHGPNGFSEPETQAIKALAEREKFQASLSFHSYSQLVLYPFAYAYNVPNPEEPVYKDLGAQMATFNKYTVQNCTDLYPAAGISDDWLYGELKAIAFTIELAEEFIPPAPEIAGICAINVPATILLIEKCAASAVNSPSGNPELPASLDLTDGLAALELGKKLLPQYCGNDREIVADRLLRVTRRVATLAAEGLLHGDRSAWNRIMSAPAARGAVPMVRNRILFEACHNVLVPSDVVAEVQAIR